MHKTQIKENQAKNTKPDLKNDKGEWICRKMVKTVKYQMFNFHFFSNSEITIKINPQMRQEMFINVQYSRRLRTS